MACQRVDSYGRLVGRKPRIEVADGFYHVVTRGNDRQAIYSANWSGRLFERLLGQTAGRFDWQVFAYCLMTNHYHLVVRIRDAGLSAGICELNGSFAKITNRRLERTNHLFGRRFWSKLIDTDEYLLTTCRYAVLNPERAGAVDDARRWRWSSLAATLGYVPAPSFLATDKLLALFARDPVQARARFAVFVEAGRGG
jgi:REP-associated tyrosine transposase